MNVKVWKKNHRISPKFINEADENYDRDPRMMARTEDPRMAAINARQRNSDAAIDAERQAAAERVARTADNVRSYDKMKENSEEILAAIYDQAIHLYEARLGKTGDLISYQLESIQSFINRNRNAQDFGSVFVKLLEVSNVEADFRYKADQSEIIENATNFDKTKNFSKLFESEQAVGTSSFLAPKQFTDPDTIFMICDCMAGHDAAKRAQTFVLVEVPEGGINDVIDPKLKTLSRSWY